MATGLIFYDGFDDYTAMSDWWTLSTGGGTIQVQTGTVRSGSHALELTNSTSVRAIDRSLGGNYQQLVVGFALRLANSPSATRDLIQLRDATTRQIELALDSSRRVVINRNQVAIATSTNSFNVDEWYYVELRVNIANAGGAVEVRVNGTNTGWINFSGDTQNSANNTVSQLFIGDATTNFSRSLFLDDLYILDYSVSGAAFLGDVRVDSLLPDGAGDSAQFTPSAGNNWENVDEAAPDGDTTYNQSATAGHIDLFTMQDLPSSTTIYGVATVLRARKTDAGTREVRGKLKTSGTTANGATHALGTTFGSYFSHFENDPGGGAWSDADVDGTQVGYEVVT